MITLEQLRRLHIRKTPWMQLLIAELGLRWSYLIPRTEIVLENAERIPKDRRVFFALNHTDRYNYWPFQYKMYRTGLPYTATWVKGKYYEKRLLARFMDYTGNIPLPSRGYLITTRFRDHQGRPPRTEEYRLLRDVLDSSDAISDSDLSSQTDAVRSFIGSFGDDGSGLLGFKNRLEEQLAAMMREVTRLTDEAFDRGLNMIVFPEGTRSVRLGKGHTGLAQMSQHLGKSIVPVGCNGSDLVYPGVSPWAKGGRIVYRVGLPIDVESPEIRPYRITEPFVPFTRFASERFSEQLDAITAVVMDRINDLLDERHRRIDGNAPREPAVRFV